MLTTSSGGAAASSHPSLTELAESAEGLLDDARSADVRAHLAWCAHCQGSAAELRAVSATLAAVPPPVMPPEVAARLDRVLAGEVVRRSAKPVVEKEEDQGSVWSRPRPTLGAFEPDRSRRSLRRVVVPALAAAAAAAVVGFGAYVASATAGLNEPPVVAAVSSSNLGAQAGALLQREELDPHWFSRAWQCARQVTDGRIVGLAASTVDGTPALLVYTRSGATTEVTVVTGCGAGRPSAGPTAEVSRR